MWVEAHYDYASFKRELLRGMPDRAFNLWRYHDVLPIDKVEQLHLVNAGGTPLVASRRFAREIGHK